MLKEKKNQWGWNVFHPTSFTIAGCVEMKGYWFLSMSNSQVHYLSWKWFFLYSIVNISPILQTILIFSKKFPLLYKKNEFLFIRHLAEPKKWPPNSLKKVSPLLYSLLPKIPSILLPPPFFSFLPLMVLLLFLNNVVTFNSVIVALLPLFLLWWW